MNELIYCTSHIYKLITRHEIPTACAIHMLHEVGSGHKEEN